MQHATPPTASSPHSHYRKLLLTLAISFVVKYVVMYLNTYELDRVCFRLARVYMTVLMVTSMASYSLP